MERKTLFVILAGLAVGFSASRALEHEVTPPPPAIAKHTWTFTQEDLEKALLLYIKAQGHDAPKGALTIDGLEKPSLEGTRWQMDRDLLKIQAGVWEHPRRPMYNATGNPPKQKPKTVLTLTIEEEIKK